MVYKNLTANNKYPFVVLNLEIPPHDVDVNVHPTKKKFDIKILIKFLILCTHQSKQDFPIMWKNIFLSDF